MPDEQKRDANDIAAQEGPEALRAQAEAGAEEALAIAARQAGLETLTELRARVGSEYRRPVIEGLLRQGETMNIVAPPKRGKALAIDTPILTEKGWSTMGELRLGMKVHAHDGTLTEIVAVTEVMYGRPCCRVTTRSGASVIADEEHQWVVRQRQISRVVATTKLLAGHEGRRWLLPVTGMLARASADLPIDPWLLGYWLGNGTSREAELTFGAEDLAHVIARIATAGFRAGPIRTRKNSILLRVAGLQAVLRTTGVLNNKHVPTCYRLSSAPQRSALFAGLLDSDGCGVTDPNGSSRVEFSSVSRVLAAQVLFLARSLGFKATMGEGRATLNGKDCGPKFRVCFAASQEASPFFLPRKTGALAPRPLSARTRGDAVVSVDRVQSVPVCCVQVRHPAGTYLAGDGLMVTHNSWLVDGLALSAVAGRPWLCPRWYCTPGNVAIIDNELHPETISARLKQVREKMGLDESLEDRVSICALRGRWTPLNGLKQVIQHLRRVQPVLLILDSLYRFLPEGSSENDNAAMAQVYNQIDQFAAMLETTGVVIIHHASKGGQFDKGITDVGRGAGAIAGATDTHLILREHEEPDCFVAEAVCRTWPKPDPVTIKWACPVWETTEHDPEKLKGVRPKNAKDKPPDSLNDAAFVSYLTGQWISPRNLVPLIAERENWGEKNTRRLVDSVISAHGLDELTREDGAKDCGTFLAERNPSCPGLRFKAKVTQ